MKHFFGFNIRYIASQVIILELEICLTRMSIARNTIMISDYSKNIVKPGVAC